MGLINNLTQPRNDSPRRLRAVETGAPMNSGAVGSGGFEVYDGGVITISNGGLVVTGSAEIIGELIASGTISFTGTLTQSGESTFTGDTSFDGPTHINGETDITGNATVTGDLSVAGGGEITAGNTKISPSASNGGIEFVSGGGVGGNGGAVVVKATGDVGLLAGTMASLFAGATSLNVKTDGVYIPALPPTSNPPNLYADSSGKLYKSTA